MSSDNPAQPTGIPAATVIIFRNGPQDGPPEILMTIRSRNMVFAGGMAVFPGGRVDPEDFELASQFEGEMEIDEAAHQIAVIRETLEETGLAIGLKGKVDADIARAARDRLLESKSLSTVLEEFEWDINLSQLTPFARWFPKNERLPRVYDTRFYLTNLGTGAVEIAADLSENTHLFWTSAKDALASAETGDIKVIFPTRRNLERLAQFASYEETKAQAEAIPIKTIVPQVDTSGSEPMLRIMEDAGYPVTAELLENLVRG
ncbi:MAG TPA: NUDIX hydrolase [Erythrobacter sp.]|nr:NUDIX hydrolase [Erythrobacter sp.]